MISLDQVLLLEKKVESAVAKIAQLTAENDALRSKCAELTNALSAQTELLSSFQSDQNKIEEGILKALEQLETVENSILGSGGDEAPASSPAEESAPADAPGDNGGEPESPEHDAGDIAPEDSAEPAESSDIPTDTGYAQPEPDFETVEEPQASADGGQPEEAYKTGSEAAESDDSDTGNAPTEYTPGEDGATDMPPENQADAPDGGDAASDDDSENKQELFDIF